MRLNYLMAATLAASLAATLATNMVAPKAVAASSQTEQAAKQSTPKPAAEAQTSAEPVEVAAAADAAKTAAAATAAKPKAKKTAPAPTLKVSIDLTKQRMTVTENGRVKHNWSISSGRKGFRTITGNFRPTWMTKMHYSRKYDNAPMPHSIFFHGGYAIHATYATGRLGAPASHGCVRLAPGNAKTLFNLVQKHGKARTRIAVFGVATDRAIAKKTTRTETATSSPGSRPPPFRTQTPAKPRSTSARHATRTGSSGSPYSHIQDAPARSSW